MYMIPARGPETVNLCNHCSAIILQSLLCNLAYNLCYAMFLQHFADNIETPLVFLGFLNSYCKKT